MSDTLRELVSAWLESRDEDAARRLVEILHPQIFRIVQNHIPRGMDAEDLAQDIFVQFFRSLERYDPSRALENWLSRLALNVCLNALRARARRPEWRWADLSAGEREILASLVNESEINPANAHDARELLLKLLDVLSGLAAVRVEQVTTAAVGAEQAFAALEQQRRSGQLSVGVSSAALRYQASTTQPGFLEEVALDGRRRLGQFRHGVFDPLEGSVQHHTP